MVSEMTGVEEFEQLLKQVSATAVQDVTEVVKVGAKKIERQLQKEMRGSRYFRGVAPNITHDVTINSDSVEAEIGPETGRGRPGALANIAYFGGSYGGGGTVRDPMLALELEAAIVEQQLADKLVQRFQ